MTFSEAIWIKKTEKRNKRTVVGDENPKTDDRSWAMLRPGIGPAVPGMCSQNPRRPEGKHLRLDEDLITFCTNIKDIKLIICVYV